MRKLIPFIFTLFTVIDVSAQSPDSLQVDTAKKVKIGWGLGALPTVSYDADRGFQYGALVNFYDYGDGSRYPGYNHSLYFEVSRYTKGSGINRFAYDSDRLIKGVRILGDVSYLTEKALDLWGFNGYDAVYKSEWEDDTNDAYKSRMFYKYEQKMFRVKADFIGGMGTSQFNWIAGFSLYNFKVGTVDIQNLNKNKDDDKLLPDTATIFDHYVDWGVIREDEKKGRTVSYIKVGVEYDTRDIEASPNRGVWTEAVIKYAPSFLGNGDYAHTKFTITHRQYVPIKENRLVFAYRLGYQQTLGAGKVPFYAQPILSAGYLRAATNQGLGGASTLRGILRNRVVGDGVFLGNLEFRYRFWNFELLNQDLYIATNIFFDTGRVIDPIDLDLSKVEVPEGETKEDYFAQDAEDFHNSFGAGLKIAMNINFVLSIDYGKALDERDGNSGLYIRLNYLF